MSNFGSVALAIQYQTVGRKSDFRARTVQIIMPEMVSTILVDFRVTTLPSEADIMEKIVRYQYRHK